LDGRHTCTKTNIIKYNCYISFCKQQQYLFTKHSENTMTEGQQGYEKHLWLPATKKREEKMNNLNNQNLALTHVYEVFTFRPTAIVGYGA